MKKLLLPILLVLTVGCSEKDAGENSQNLSLTFELDTVMVDAGEDFVYLKNWLRTADVSRDGQNLLIFNPHENLLEVVDLENMRLAEKIPYDREGPNGTGDVMGFQYLDDSRFVLTTYQSIGIFGDGGMRTTHFDFSNSQAKNVWETGRITTEGVWLEELETFIAYYTRGYIHKKGLVKIHPKSGSMEKIHVQHIEDLDRFCTEIPSPYSVSATATETFISEFEGRVLLSSHVRNDLMVYDPQTDSLSLYTFDSQLTPNAQKESAKREVETQEELNKAIAEKQKDVRFGKWLFDGQTERFYRLTYLPREGADAQVVLTILDRDFQQVYEGITPFKKSSNAMFFRQGKLYLFENMDDEMGFLILSIQEA